MEDNMIICSKCTFEVSYKMRHAISVNACPSCGVVLLNNIEVKKISTIVSKLKKEDFSETLGEELISDISFFISINNGKFVFSASEAYKIKDGAIGAPVKGATLIGSGFEVLKKVKAVGNDMEFDPGIGTCGKNGQLVPVGVGQPTLLIDGLTVGGTEALE